jgi:hypothetical protein
VGLVELLSYSGPVTSILLYDLEARPMSGDIELATLVLSLGLFLSNIISSAALVVAARQIAKGLRTGNQKLN